MRAPKARVLPLDDTPVVIDYFRLTIGEKVRNWLPGSQFPAKSGISPHRFAPHRKRYLRQAASSSGGVAFFILLDIVDEPLNFEPELQSLHNKDFPQIFRKQVFFCYQGLIFGFKNTEDAGSAS